MQAVVGLQIPILQLLLLFCFSLLHMSQFHACGFVILCLCSEWTFLLHCLTQETKGSQWLYHNDIAALWLLQSNSPKQVDVVSSDQRVYSNLQLYRLLRVTMLLRRITSQIPYNNQRYYCWAENLMLRRNWALQTKPAVQYLIKAHNKAV